VAGPVIKAYNAPVKEMGHELKRSTFLVDSPNANLSSQGASKQIVCNALAGTPVSFTGRTADSGPLKDYWQEVTINTGACAGKSGWVGSDSLSMK
jgi:hypothetical protein